MKALINGRIIGTSQIHTGLALLFNNKIVSLCPISAIPENCQVIDVKGRFIAPGFIDIHIHGAGGSDVMDGKASALTTIAETIARFGVTSFLPTTITQSPSKIYHALEAVRQAKNKSYSGALILGAHLEGPFLNANYKGAQSAEHLCQVQLSLFQEYYDVVRIMTLAPEVDKNFKLIRELNRRNIVAAIGHSGLSYQQGLAAIQAGVSHASHLFNASKAFHHREPGVVGAVLSSSATCDLIADTIHVHPAIFSMLLCLKGKGNLMLITDAIRATGMGKGQFELGGQQVFVDSTSARLKDGTLAGSILQMNQALKNFVDHTKISLVEAIQLVSSNQAKLLNVDDSKGSIEVGKDADLVVFDEQYEVKMTIVGGRVVYTTSGGPALL